MRSLAQVQLAESSGVERVKRNLAKSIKAEPCTVSVLFLVPSCGCVKGRSAVIGSLHEPILPAIRLTLASQRTVAGVSDSHLLALCPDVLF